jgi:hypothetical protein
LLRCAAAGAQPSVHRGGGMLKQLINDRLRGILRDFIYFDESSYHFTGAVRPPGALEVPARSWAAAGCGCCSKRRRPSRAAMRSVLVLPRPAGRASTASARACAGGVTSCQVLLENVRVKESAFAQLGLPIRVKSGVVGKLDLAIPYGSLYTKPVRRRGGGWLRVHERSPNPHQAAQAAHPPHPCPCR